MNYKGEFRAAPGGAHEPHAFLDVVTQFSPALWDQLDAPAPCASTELSRQGHIPLCSLWEAYTRGQDHPD